jgi:hypothetical protein
MARYKATQPFSITVSHLRKTITDSNFTDQDAEYLCSRFGGKYNHNFERVSDLPTNEVELEYVDFKPLQLEDLSDKELREQAKILGVNLGRTKDREKIIAKIQEELS